MISRYEYSFMNLALEIVRTGFHQENKRTGIGTKRLPHGILQCDLQKEFPILTSKKCFYKSAIEEVLWIYQKQSNNIKDLRPHIWDAWADEDGSIGKAYGYQVKQFSQVDYVLKTLHEDSSSRRALMDLWNFADLNEMNLTPCVYTSVWDLVDGKLNVLVTSRSCDLLVGGVFNVIQYAALCHMFARDLGVEPGMITFVAADVHIYDNQIDGFTQWMKQYKQELACGRYWTIETQVMSNYSRKALNEKPDLDEDALVNYVMENYLEETKAAIKKGQDDLLESIASEYRESANVMMAEFTNDYLKEVVNPKNNTDFTSETLPKDYLKDDEYFNTELTKIENSVKDLYQEMTDAIMSDEYKMAYFCTPNLKINPDKKSFFEMTIDDFELENYHCLGKIDLPVAV